MTTELRSILFTLDANERVSAFAKRALRVFKSFSLRFGPEGLSASLGVDPERGFGDSGDLSTDLTALLIAIGEAAREQDTAVFIAVDEAQYLNKDELNAVIMALHRVNQLTLPIVAVLTGLPQIIQLAGEAKSYAERIFDFRMIGALDDTEARRAITEPAHRMGVEFAAEALNELAATTGGYPFFIQEWGYEVWNVATASPIGVDAVKTAMPRVLKKLDEGFFSVRYRRAVPAERYYLRAMAEVGAGPYRVSEILEVSKRTSRQFGPYRDSLIKKGLIFSPEHGQLAFTVPLFDEFMRRQEPSFAPRSLRT